MQTLIIILSDAFFLLLFLFILTLDRRLGKLELSVKYTHGRVMEHINEIEHNLLDFRGMLRASAKELPDETARAEEARLSAGIANLFGYGLHEASPSDAAGPDTEARK
jgi:hypothetical protein